MEIVPIAPPARPIRPAVVIAVLALAVIVAALFVEAPPHSALGKADIFGFAVCHRIPARTYFLGGHQLPLCARCTGTFLGGLLGLGGLLVRRRPRASSLPPVPVLFLMLVFMAAWALDGLNSYLGFFPGAPQLYEPRNWLRLTTGLLNGLALAGFLFPVANFTLWHRPDPQPAIKNVWELLAMLPFAGLVVGVLQAGIDWLLYPLALLSSAGVLTLLTVVNAMLAAIVLRLEGRSRTWRQVAVPLAAGLAIALVEVTALALLRAWLTAEFGLDIAGTLG